MNSIVNSKETKKKTTVTIKQDHIIVGDFAIINKNVAKKETLELSHLEDKVEDS